MVEQSDRQTGHLDIALMKLVRNLLASLDVLYFACLFLTADNRWVVLGLAVLFPATNAPAVELSLRTGRSYVKWVGIFSLLPLFGVTWLAGPNSPAWLMCISACIGTVVYTSSGRRFQFVLLSANVALVLLGSYLAGRTPIELAGIAVALFAFSAVSYRLIGFLIAKDVSEEAALAASEAKSQFLAHMSHELRTPLNGVIGMLELLQGTKLDEEQRNYAQTASTSGKSLLTIINDILDFSRIEAGKLDLDPAVFDLRTLTAELEDLIGYRAQEKGLALAISLAPDVDPWLVGDPGRLRQVLTNLGYNAVKFTERGQVRIEVTAADERETGVTLRFEVHDTGMGIPLEQQERLFGSFSQLDGSITRKHGGSGLGLAISKALVERMDGEIGVRSEPGEGSCFWFTARLERPAPGQRPSEAPDTDAAPGDATEVPAPSSAERPAMKVLVAEDNPINQRVAAAFLTKLGCEVECVEDGQQAIDAVAAGSYDLVFMDCQMPVLDGLSATEAIRAHERREDSPRVPVVAMTANAIKGDRERCLEAGMDDYLTKPVTRAQVAEVLDRWTESDRRARRS